MAKTGKIKGLGIFFVFYIEKAMKYKRKKIEKGGFQI